MLSTFLGGFGGFFASNPGCTSWKTNMSPEKQWLEDVFPIEKIIFGGIC